MFMQVHDETGIAAALAAPWSARASPAAAGAADPVLWSSNLATVPTPGSSAHNSYVPPPPGEAVGGSQGDAAFGHADPLLASLAGVSARSSRCALCVL